MRKIFLFFSLLISFTTNILFAQYEIKDVKIPPFPWPEGKKCAVTLSFDDSRPSQVEKGIPLLNKYDIDATFYVLPQIFTRRTQDWKNAVVEGHEIGNHSTTHPCTGSYTFSYNNALENYTIEKLWSDINDANKVIEENLGVKPKSFGYPCGQKFVSTGKETKSYVPLIAENFLAGRGWLGEATNKPWICDLSQLLGMESDGKSFEQLKELVDNAKEEGSWLILAGHEMDDSGSQTTYLKELEKLCQYLKDSENGIWVGTVEEIATYIKEKRK